MTTYLQAEQLRNAYRGIITAFGGTSEEAEIFADCFVIADLRGMDWQGLKSIDSHLIFPLQNEIVRLGQDVELISEDASSLVLEAHGELGQLVCSRAMDVVTTKAANTGAAVAAIRHCGDTGLLAAYTLSALEHDCIGIVFNNTNPYVAPWGGSERTHGIDPLSISIPAGEEFPILLDMSITKAKPVFDTDAAWTRPFLPPSVLMFDTVREYGLSVVVEAISGALSAMPMGRDKTKRGESAVVCMAIHIAHFIDSVEFRGHVDRFIRQIRATKHADGVQEIFLPGERGFREQERRLRDGIPVDDDVLSMVIDSAKSIGVDWSRAIEGGSADVASLTPAGVPGNRGLHERASQAGALFRFLRRERQ